MKTYKKIMDVIAECEKIVMSLVLVFVTVITFVNVLVRKLTTSQFAWSEELVIVGFHDLQRVRFCDRSSHQLVKRLCSHAAVPLLSCVFAYRALFRKKRMKKPPPFRVTVLCLFFVV